MRANYLITMDLENVFEGDGAARGQLNRPIQRIRLLPVPLIDLLEREQEPLPQVDDDAAADIARFEAEARNLRAPELRELIPPQNGLNIDELRERRRRPLFLQPREQRAAVAPNDHEIELRLCRDTLRFWCTYALCKKLIQNRAEEPDYQFGDWMRRTPEFMTAYQIITTASMRAERPILGEINPWNFNEIRPVHQQNRIDFLLVQQLVTASGINVTFRDWSGRNCLYIAVERRNVQLVEFLLEHGANTDTFGMYNSCSVSFYLKMVFFSQGMWTLFARQLSLS
ncbi:hypothetical protein QAD02_023946 [Eretmocerus hayati]|uniref:Uncharacterized protein n=1 Tax=Eretmocerus hayati TaxID=131215 RepID=A0ACC2PZG6_9HYME|nr:hypothetical protein QAD02_023946 [Eretmocerus hayati]